MHDDTMTVDKTYYNELKDKAAECFSVRNTNNTARNVIAAIGG